MFRMQAMHPQANGIQTQALRRESGFKADLVSAPKLTGEVALFETDEYGFISSWSYKAEQVYGFDFDEMIGKHISSLYIAGDLLAGKPVHELLAVESKGKHFAFAWQKRKNGQEFWTYSECQSLRDNAGKLAGYRKFVVETSTANSSQAAC